MKGMNDCMALGGGGIYFGRASLQFESEMIFEARFASDFFNRLLRFWD